MVWKCNLQRGMFRGRVAIEMQWVASSLNTGEICSIRSHGIVAFCGGGGG